MYVSAKKKYIPVLAAHIPGHTVQPLYLRWKGDLYKIKVIETKYVASTKAGGTGLRYTIKIGDKQTYLWLEETNSEKMDFFVEEK